VSEFIGVAIDDAVLRRVVVDAINHNLGYVKFNAVSAVEGPIGQRPQVVPQNPVAPARAGMRVGPGPAFRRGNLALAPAPATRPDDSARIRPPKVVAALQARREMRRIPPAARSLPTTISNPFFQELQARWPEVPTIAEPVSQMCTTSQFGERAYDRIRVMLRLPRHLHRKQWEFVYIYRAVEQAGMVGRGYRGLVFGVGREKLPSLFVAKGCRILATDLPVEEGDGRWVGGAQHADSLDKIFYPPIVDRDEFYANAAYRPVNMNAIPTDLEGFDFCWSACALEHLGSLERGLDFIRNSLKCLRPGGVAVHTTEFNLGSGTETLEDGPSVVYRERDLVDFARELQDQGHEVILNLHPGAEPTDRMVDRDRNSDIHLRLYARHRILATSCGLCIRKVA
jgi:SAM-dependent methyltransferase